MREGGRPPVNAEGAGEWRDVREEEYSEGVDRSGACW